MGTNSAIEWTGATWNPVTGCTKVSAGCENCYAERMSHRLQAMGQFNYAKGFVLDCHEHSLELPLQWRRPRVIFVNSMSDLFHKDVPSSFIEKVFDVMNRANWHKYQILTKRSSRLLEMDGQLKWADHILMGVSVEDSKVLHRIDDLRLTHARTKFLSIEPLLGPLPHLNLDRIDWVIVGGESGPRARPMDERWVKNVRDQCIAESIPFFFKQWGGVNKKKTGRCIEGRIWDELPKVLSRSSPPKN